MDENLTDITFVLDETGSMWSQTLDVINGYKEFIQAQQDADGDALFTFVRFNSNNPQKVTIHAKDIKEVGTELKDYDPRSMTPLYDAIGMAVDATGKRLGVMEESKRPGKVVFVVFTDGEENMSQEYTQTQIKDMITHQSEKYNWKFVFLGADIDAMAEGGKLGFSADNTADVSTENTRSAIGMTARKVASYRDSGLESALSYTKGDRDSLKSQ